MFAAIYIAVNAIITDVNTNGFSVDSLFRNKVFYTLIVSVMSTYGIWLIASLLMFDPWHMFTSLIQYMLLSPTYTNVLNVYAFCNTHDITWGTKGDDKPEELPDAKTGKDGQGKIDLPDEVDLNTQYEKELRVFGSPEVKVAKAPTAKQEAEAQEDYYRGVRTVVVLVWMIMNFALCAVVLSSAGVEKIVTGDDGRTEEEVKSERANIYLSIVLWSVAGLSAFKFLGAMWFLVVRMFRGVWMTSFIVEGYRIPNDYGYLMYLVGLWLRVSWGVDEAGFRVCWGVLITFSSILLSVMQGYLEYIPEQPKFSIVLFSSSLLWHAVIYLMNNIITSILVLLSLTLIVHTINMEKWESKLQHLLHSQSTTRRRMIGASTDPQASYHPWVHKTM